MDTKLVDYIKLLSKTDRKSLSLKTLKTTEELGELAKAILPYENAYATTHRFITKNKILEECADVFLCIKSIVYDLDFTDNDFEEMVSFKTKFWADLQAREKIIKYPIPFEIHVTVNPNNKSLDEYKNDCNELKVKPILLDLHLKNNDKLKDMMTSSVIMGNNTDAYNELQRISSGLKYKGYEVIREKIETIPWHPAAPSNKHNNPTMPKDCYFESHLNILCTDARKDLLKNIADKHKAKRSSNAFKKFEDGSFTIMVTYRDYFSVYEDFKSKLEEIKNDIIENGFQVAKEIIEFSIFDTKVSHDAKWILQQ